MESSRFNQNLCTKFQERLYRGFRHHCTDRSVWTPDIGRYSSEEVPNQICIIQLTFRDKHEPRAVQIIRLEKHAQNKRLVLLLYAGDFY
jgi:hypothetical protein